MPNRLVVISIALISLGVASYFLLPRSELSKLSAAVKPISISENAPAPLEEKNQIETESHSTQSKLLLIRELIKNKNDNDPRYDLELKHLSDELKTELIALYRSTKLEDRNGRGTIVFLLGRNIRSSDDVKFFQEVISEAPCLSLGDCSKLPNREDFEDIHADGSEEVTLQYPKLVALSSIERLAQTKDITDDIRNELKTTLELAKQDAEDRISAKAEQILNSLHHRE